MPLSTFSQPGQETFPPALALPYPAPGAGSRERPQDPAAGRRDGTVTGPGRPQKELPPDSPAVAAVAAELRRLREEEGLTFRALADEAEYSLATVTAALAGKRLPTWNVTRAL